MILENNLNSIDWLRNAPEAVNAEQPKPVAAEAGTQEQQQQQQPQAAEAAAPVEE